METYRDIDPMFVDKFLYSIYVENVCVGADDVELFFDCYLKLKFQLPEAGFKLWKFVTNSTELRD